MKRTRKIDGAKIDILNPDARKHVDFAVVMFAMTIKTGKLVNGTRPMDIAN